MQENAKKFDNGKMIILPWGKTQELAARFGLSMQTVRQALIGTPSRRPTTAERRALVRDVALNEYGGSQRL